MPPLISLLGLGSALSTAFFGRFRWLFAGLSVAFLATAFLFAYRLRPSRASRRIAWVLAAATVAAVAYGVTVGRPG